MTNPPGRSHAFSLVEVLVAVAIVGILAVLAMTSVEQYRLRARRTIAHEALLSVAHAQELHRAVFSQYADTLPALHVSSSAAAAYTIELDHDMLPGFRARATPVGRQRRDACGTLTIDHLGRRSSSRVQTSPSKPDNCW